MSENFADAIISHAPAWAAEAGVTEIDFTYGVLYGTQKQSNKKDWHIIRNLAEKLPEGCFHELPNNRWQCGFTHQGIRINATIRVGKSWWDFLGGQTCLVELCAALIRACVRPGEIDADDQSYTISYLADIVSTRSVPQAFNSALLQRSQIPVSYTHLDVYKRQPHSRPRVLSAFMLDIGSRCWRSTTEPDWRN